MISAAQGAEKKTPLNPNGGTWPSIIAWQCLSLLLKPAYPPAWQTMGTPVRWKLFLLFFPRSLFFSPSDHGSPPGAHSTVEAAQLPPGNWDVLDKLCLGFVHELTLVCCCSNTVNDELPLFFPHPFPLSCPPPPPPPLSAPFLLSYLKLSGCLSGVPPPSGSWECSQGALAWHCVHDT